MNGSFVLAGNTNLYVDRDLVRNDAGLTISGGSRILRFDDESAISRLTQNRGRLDLVSGAQLAVSNFINEGAVTIDETSAYESPFDYVQTAGSTRNNGTLFANNIYINGGVLEGSGVITGHLWIDGVLQPGNSPGALTIFGDLTLNPDARLVLELGGSDPSLWDRIFVSGNINLGGILELVFLNGFRPTGGFDLLFGSSIHGAFSEIYAAGMRVSTYMEGGKFGLNLEPKPAVPEPGSLLLAAAGVALLAARRIRSNQSDKKERS